MHQRLVLEQLEKDLKTLCKTPMGRRYFLASLPVILSGCAMKKTSDRHREGSNKGQKTSITVKDEIKMTNEYLPQLRKEYPAYQDEYLQKYINYVGQKIVKANKLDGKPYKYNFTLVETDQVNAFAMPAGTVFVTGPLLAMANSEAELAGVIGHEVGHIQARHTAERMDAAKKDEAKTLLYGIGGAILGGAAGYAAGQAACKSEKKNKQKYQECVERATKYGAIAGGAGAVLIQKYWFMANSREDEMEADRIGYRTAVKAGYHKDHVGLFYEKLLKMEQQSKKGQNSALTAFADAMSTHPPSKERVKQMREMASTEKTFLNGKVSSSAFQKVKAKVQKLIKA